MRMYVCDAIFSTRMRAVGIVDAFDIAAADKVLDSLALGVGSTHNTALGQIGWSMSDLNIQWWERSLGYAVSVRTS